MQRVALGFTGAHASIDTYLTGAVAAEERGFEAVWFAEDYFFRDTLSVATAVAMETSNIDLGLFVNPYTRSPALTAMSAASLNEITEGNVRTTMGAGPPMVMERIVDYESPLYTTKEAVEVMRALLSEDDVDYEGRFFDYEGVTLGVCEYMPYFDRFASPDEKIPINIAATGPQMLKMAGDVGDGLAISVGFTPEMAADAIDRAKEGLAMNDRSFEDYNVSAFIFTSAEITDRAKQFAALNVATVRSDEELVAQDLKKDRVAAVRETFETEGLAAASKEVSESMVKTFVLTGTQEECHRRLDAFVNAGVDVPILLHLAGDPEATVDIGAAWAAE